MKPQTAVIGTLAMLLASWVAAKAPDIDPARIDSIVKEVLQQADQNPNQTQKPDGAAIRKDVLIRLQTLEILKSEALKVGLDKDPEVQNQFKNMEASFYADQYTRYLERQAVVSDSELRRFYEQQTRMIKLQQVSFNSPEQARSAQDLLRKGLSFEELMKRYPNPEQTFNHFIMPQQLPPVLGRMIEQMNRGDVSHEPVALDGKFYLFKLSAVEHNPDAQPFELVRHQIEQQAKQQKVGRQINQILENNGIRP